MSDKIMFLFCKDELARIVITEQAGGRKLITVDMHGLKTKEAKRFLKNLIAINKESCDICVIHGFNHGTSIKEMVNKDDLGSRVVGRIPVRHNPGRTRLKLAAA